MSLPFGLGTVHLTWPWMLAGLAVLPLFLLGARTSRVTMAAALCRTFGICALLLTLAGLFVSRPTPEVGSCVIAAIDISASVHDAAAETAADYLGPVLAALGPNDVIGSVAFASRAHVVHRPTQRPQHVEALIPTRSSAGSPTGLDHGNTDIAAALATAAALCPAGKQTALLLFTDGNETHGSVLAEAALTEPRVPVFPIIPPRSALPPGRIRRMLAPAFVPEHSMVPIELVLESRADEPMPVLLRVSANGRSIVHDTIELAPGLSVIAVPHRLRKAGHYLLESALDLATVPDDASRSVRHALTVTKPLRVLVVSARTRPIIARALGARGMQVEMLTPAAFDERSRELRDTHVVVLDDVARASIGSAALERIADHVAGGGGLIVTGGKHLFGDLSYNDTALTRLLPVELQPQSPAPRERAPIALYLLIDRSNSMGYASGEPTLPNGQKIVYSKRAAIAVLDQLGPRDLVGAIAFDSQPYELSPMAPVAEAREILNARIPHIQHGGGTDFKDALDIARRNLIDSGRAVRHIILLTDGDTNRGADDHGGVIAALARAEITVTTIRVGSDTINVELLENISRATGGAFHHVAHAEALPTLMMRDARRLIHDRDAQRDLPVRVAYAGRILAGIDERELPSVDRWALTRPRRGADVRLYVPIGDERDPLLATWQYELGRVAAVPVDFQAGGSAWPTWDGFGKLWTQLVSWAAPPALVSDHRLEARRQRDGTLLRLTTLVDDAGPFALHLPEVGDFRLRQTAPRTFTATVPSLHAGLHRATLLSGGGGTLVEEPVTLMVPATSEADREYRAGDADVELLTSVATLTGGRVGPKPGTALKVQPGFARAVMPLDWLLVPLALLLLLADVALRRSKAL